MTAFTCYTLQLYYKWSKSIDKPLDLWYHILAGKESTLQAKQNYLFRRNNPHEKLKTHCGNDFCHNNGRFCNRIRGSFQ